MNRIIQTALVCTLAAAALLTALAYLLWPPGTAVGALLGVALASLAVALRRGRRRWRHTELPQDEAAALIEEQVRVLEDQERRLELRELRLRTQ